MKTYRFIWFEPDPDGKNIVSFQRIQAGNIFEAIHQFRKGKTPCQLASVVAIVTEDTKKTL